MSDNNYTSWETAVTDHISNTLQCSYSDAAAIIEANNFWLTQSWGIGLAAEATGNRIIEKTSK